MARTDGTWRREDVAIGIGRRLASLCCKKAATCDYADASPIGQPFAGSSETFKEGVIIFATGNNLLFFGSFRIFAKQWEWPCLQNKSWDKYKKSGRCPLTLVALRTSLGLVRRAEGR
ncbi:hypothetical protein KC363_g174 [Hortaea werneckii]|nr:hypothetical protein KC363_g174 [Hortaea werneckii]